MREFRATYRFAIQAIKSRGFDGPNRSKFCRAALASPASHVLLLAGDSLYTDLYNEFQIHDSARKALPTLLGSFGDVLCGLRLCLDDRPRLRLVFATPAIAVLVGRVRLCN